MSEDLVLPGMEMKKDKKNQDVSVKDKISLDAGVAAENELPEQGAMFVGEEGRLLLPHFMQLPRKIKKGKYVDISKEIAKISKEHNLGEPHPRL